MAGTVGGPCSNYCTPPELPEPLAPALPAHSHTLPEDWDAHDPVGSSGSNLCPQCERWIILSWVWYLPSKETQTEGRKGACPELKSIFHENISSYNHTRFRLCLWLGLLRWHFEREKGKGNFCRFPLTLQALCYIPSATLLTRSSTG